MAGGSREATTLGRIQLSLVAGGRESDRRRGYARSRVSSEELSSPTFAFLG